MLICSEPCCNHFKAIPGENSWWGSFIVSSELLGGCDIILEMAAEGELKSTLQESLGVESQEALHARIKALVEGSPVMLFMKGSRDEPKCGFSRKVRPPQRVRVRDCSGWAG